MSYTYADFRRDEVHSGLSAASAAAELLGHDGAEWDIRADADQGFWLWHRKPNGGRNKWVKTFVYSAHSNCEAAAAEIYSKVIISGAWEHDDMFCGPDEAYAQMSKDMEAE